MDNFNSSVNSVLDTFFRQDSLGRWLLVLCIVLYGHLAAPFYPPKFMYLIDNIYFRVFIISLIAWTASNDPTLSLAITLVLFAFMSQINKYNNEHATLEKFEGPNTAIYPGCMNITVQDLLDSFSGNKDALLTAMLNSRIPLDVKLSDYYAPIIATYLLNYGFVLKSPCSPPTVNQNFAN